MRLGTPLGDCAYYIPQNWLKVKFSYHFDVYQLIQRSFYGLFYWETPANEKMSQIKPISEPSWVKEMNKNELVQCLFDPNYLKFGTKLRMTCMLSIFPAGANQSYANILVLKNVSLFLYIKDQFALLNKQEFKEFQEKVILISSFDFYSDFR